MIVWNLNKKKIVSTNFQFLFHDGVKVHIFNTYLTDPFSKSESDMMHLIPWGKM